MVSGFFDPHNSNRHGFQDIPVVCLLDYHVHFHTIAGDPGRFSLAIPRHCIIVRTVARHVSDFFTIETPPFRPQLGHFFVRHLCESGGFFPRTTRIFGSPTLLRTPMARRFPFMGVGRSLSIIRSLSAILVTTAGVRIIATIRSVMISILAWECG